MAWQMSGQLTEFCSCKLMCPCWFGPAPVPDQGWCSGAILYDIEQGQIDGIDVGGRKVVFAADWPGNFFGGQGPHACILTTRPVPTSVESSRQCSVGRRAGCWKG
jgi:hypothetical protein